MLAPLAVAGESLATADDALSAVVTYLAIYAAMNLGAFAVIIAVARRTASAEIGTYKGLFRYSPGLAVAMTIFLMALAGIPPLGGWFAKFEIVLALLSPGTAWGVALGVIVAVNSVIALYYYARIASYMWVETPPEEAGLRHDVAHQDPHLGLRRPGPDRRGHPRLRHPPPMGGPLHRRKPGSRPRRLRGSTYCHPVGRGRQ